MHPGLINLMLSSGTFSEEIDNDFLFEISWEIANKGFSIKALNI